MSVQAGDIKQLSTLVAVSQALAGTLHLQDALRQVLELLEHHHGMLPSMVTLLDKPDGDLVIAAAHGLSSEGPAVVTIWGKASPAGWWRAVSLSSCPASATNRCF